jgi:hypothetical protein
MLSIEIPQRVAPEDVSPEAIITLDEYRRAERLTVAALAARLGLHGVRAIPSVSSFLAHDRTPSGPLMRKIMKMSGGMVTEDSFLLLHHRSSRAA